MAEQWTVQCLACEKPRWFTAESRYQALCRVHQHTEQAHSFSHPNAVALDAMVRRLAFRRDNV
eukprot:11387446-Heterocapsa_arctica.AAC.1